MILIKLMRRAMTVLSVCAVSLFAVSVSSGLVFAQGPSQALIDDANSSFIFVLRDAVKADKVQQKANDMAMKHGGKKPHFVFKKAVKGFSASMSATAAARLAAENPDIAYYEPNIVVSINRSTKTKKPGNTPGGGGGGTTEPAQITPWGITRVGGAQDGTGKHAWIIDTGIDLKNADLNVGSGANFVFSFGKPSADDGNGHGTHVAGTIAAIDNAIGVVGVAAGATVHPVRVLDNSGSGTIDGVIAGVDYVAANGSPGDVANMSLTGYGSSATLESAVRTAANLGISFALAAGNDSDYAGYYTPARTNDYINVPPRILTVSAIDANDVFASFSNYGNPPVDFAAPGVAVTSLKRGGGTITYNGTSMAAPHVAGLLLAGFPVADGYAISDPDGSPDPIAHR